MQVYYKKNIEVLESSLTIATSLFQLKRPYVKQLVYKLDITKTVLF